MDPTLKNGSGWVQEARTPGGDWLVLQILGHVEDALCERPEQKVYFQDVSAIKYFVGWTKDSNFGWNLSYFQKIHFVQKGGKWLWPQKASHLCYPPLVTLTSLEPSDGILTWQALGNGWRQNQKFLDEAEIA